MFTAGFGLDPSVDIEVSDKVSDELHYKWEGVSGRCRSQSVPRGPLVRIARDEDHAQAEDD